MVYTKRLAKFISDSGLCSRRDAEKLIIEGKVSVDNFIVSSPAINVSSDNQIRVEGKLINKKSHDRLWIYYKPTGLITTHKDPFARDTVFEKLINFPRVISIGRLDLNSEGLLLLTNSGDIAHKLELPSNKFKRVYHVRAYGDPKKLLSSNHNILKIKGIYYKPESIKLLKKKSKNAWFEVVLTEGKNREIRKIFEYFNLQVNKLIRIQYGNFTLGKLKPGEYEEINLEQIKEIKKES